MKFATIIISLFLYKPVWSGWSFCPEGSTTPCSASNQRCGPERRQGPRFHFHDLTCGMNDPNAPFYDPNHGLYHVFYQDHIGRPIPQRFPQGFEGPSWGHGVSPDMVRWAHLPVAMWNGEDWYDSHAIFTGSATIVNGTTPVLVFPGVCDMYPPAGNPGCRYGYTFGMAVPSNISDPFLRNWSKSDLNPIVNDTFDDPSSAWTTSSGELRWIANCGDGHVGDCGPNGTPNGTQARARTHTLAHIHTHSHTYTGSSVRSFGRFVLFSLQNRLHQSGRRRVRIFVPAPTPRDGHAPRPWHAHSRAQMGLSTLHRCCPSLQLGLALGLGKGKPPAYAAGWGSSA